MKKTLISIFVFAFSLNVYAQSFLQKEIEKLRKIKGYEITETEGNRLKIKRPNGKIIYYNLGEQKQRPEPIEDIPTFVFNYWELDTNDYNRKYIFEQDVPVESFVNGPVVGDINNNGRKEIYGFKKELWEEAKGVYCYEQDKNGIFKEVYEYGSITPVSIVCGQARNIYDVDGDGEPELQMVLPYVYYDTLTNEKYLVHDQLFYRKSENNSLATEKYFDYRIWEIDSSVEATHFVQLDNFTLGDFDKDGITESIYYAIDEELRIAKFNKKEKTFDSLFTHIPFDSDGYELFIQGFTYGDFDMDGKTDIVYGADNGDIFLIENMESNKYKINWTGNSGIYNSYINFKTEDINNNGKPEFWIGGQDFVNVYSKIVGFETNGDNAYEPIAEIILPGLVSLDGLSGFSADVNLDGKDELCFRIGSAIFILNYTGSNGGLGFDVYYYRDLSNYSTEYIAVDAFSVEELGRSKYPSILFSIFEYNSVIQESRVYTKIYKNNVTVGVGGEGGGERQNRCELRNYPNPFNPTTIINYAIPDVETQNFASLQNVILKVYDALGREVATLVDKKQVPGNYSVRFDAENLPSGVYFIMMRAGKYTKTIKTLLMK